MTIMRNALDNARKTQQAAPLPGPFGSDPARRRGSDLGAALGTSLLVMYPVIATVVLLLAGLSAVSGGLG